MQRDAGLFRRAALLEVHHLQTIVQDRLRGGTASDGATRTRLDEVVSQWESRGMRSRR